MLWLQRLWNGYLDTLLSWNNFQRSTEARFQGWACSLKYLSSWPELTFCYWILFMCLWDFFRSLSNIHWFQKPCSPFCFSILLALGYCGQTMIHQVFPLWSQSLNVKLHVTPQKHHFFSIYSRRRDVWHRNTPFIEILDFVGVPVECADILWLDGYLNMSCVCRGEAIPAWHPGISSSSWSLQPKAPCWETFWIWLCSIDCFSSFSVEILRFTSNPIIFREK